MYDVRVTRWYRSGHNTQVVEYETTLPFVPLQGVDLRLHEDAPADGGEVVRAYEVGLVSPDRITWDAPRSRFEVEEDFPIGSADDMYDEVDLCVRCGWRRVPLERALRRA